MKVKYIFKDGMPTNGHFTVGKIYDTINTFSISDTTDFDKKIVYITLCDDNGNITNQPLIKNGESILFVDISEIRDNIIDDILDNKNQK